MIVAPRNILFKLAKRGLIEDIYPYIDSDKELSREDFLTSVLKAYEIDGKLVLVSYSMDGITKAILTGMLSDHLNWEEGKCDFVNERFYELMDVIEYVREHSDIQYEQDLDSELSLIKEEKLLFS